jgi:hypothetical protein
MEVYQRTRDEQVLPIYEFTSLMARLEPPPPDLQLLLPAIHGNQRAMDGFVQMTAAVLSPTEFFSERNVQRILAEAAGRVSKAAPESAADQSSSCS